MINIIDPSNLERGRYISEGAFGRVYLGTYNNMKVAIKCYYRYCDNKEIIEESFLKEVEILSMLRHPNILLYMGMSYDKDTNEWMMVSEYLSNGSLYDHLYKDNVANLPKKFIPNMIQQIINAMCYTHSKKFVHCDLKSSNILIDEQWQIKVADFGLSKKIIRLDRKHDTRVGTFQWMAPEILRNCPNTWESDVWAFGLIVWEILFQKIPFKGMTRKQIVEKVGFEEDFVDDYLWN